MATVEFILHGFCKDIFVRDFGSAQWAKVAEMFLFPTKRSLGARSAQVFVLLVYTVPAYRFVTAWENGKLRLIPEGREGLQAERAVFLVAASVTHTFCIRR